jgi:hypothetical protein
MHRQHLLDHHPIGSRTAARAPNVLYTTNIGLVRPRAPARTFASLTGSGHTLPRPAFRAISPVSIFLHYISTSHGIRGRGPASMPARHAAVYFLRSQHCRHGHGHAVVRPPDRPTPCIPCLGQHSAVVCCLRLRPLAPLAFTFAHEPFSPPVRSTDGFCADGQPITSRTPRTRRARCGVKCGVKWGGRGGGGT